MNQPKAIRPSRPVKGRTAEVIADVMFALSSPSRLEIVGCLLEGPRSVGQLVESLGMEQSAVSHQLRVLRDHGLVRADRMGRQRVYELCDEHIAALLDEALSHVERAHKERQGLFGGPRRRSRTSEV